MVALLGGFAWLLTREHLSWRLAILALVFITKEVNWHTHALDVLAFPGWIDWLLRWSYVQYLFVVLLGTIVGDVLFGISMVMVVISGVDYLVKGKKYLKG